MTLADNATQQPSLSPPSIASSTVAAGQPQVAGYDWTPTPDAVIAVVVPSSSSYFYVAFSVAMVIGPVIGYLEQWRKMHQQRTSEGYSPAVSMILIACNTFRIVYFLGEPYALMLLWQSAVMLVVQLGLLVTVAKLNMAKRILQNAAIGGVHDESSSRGTSHANASFSTKARSALRACNPLNFTPSQLLLRFVVALVSLILLGLWLFSVSPVKAPTMVGYLSLGIEATLVTPQLLLNFQRRSTEGLSWLLVVTWCLGDVIKMVFFIVESQPAPFVVCGTFQIGCDALVLLQLWRYRDPLLSRRYGVQNVTDEEAQRMSEK
jgi:solute carrier family 66, member 2